MHRAITLSGIAILLTAARVLAGGSPILGEIEIEPASKVERDAGVWVDGQYVGFVKNLHGSDRLVLVPGEHRLLFKLIGYQDVDETFVVEPGRKAQYRVSMAHASGISYPDKDQTAKVRISVEPEDAAVFVNDSYVGHVDRFDGHKGMRLAPGTYRFKIALPGYQPFETQLTVRAAQAYEIKTKLPKGGFEDQGGELSARTAAGAAK
ncbi:MAG TPA: PEGA domain-containing protein [Gammaproteobacteria bacterium]|nr:PEGA domain-containing protein [Gammaproteobacteria bacterium]